MTTAIKVMCATFVCLAVSEAGVTGEDKRFIFNSKYTWASWQSYGPCNCGDGTKSRHRLCDEIDTDTGARKQSGVRNCRGYSTMFVPCSCAGGNCNDALSSCSAYGKTVCQQPYLDWAKTNCNKFCGFCDNGQTAGQCRDYFDSCSSYSKSVCQQNVIWTRKNCQKFCGYCDEVNGGWSSWSTWTTCSKSCDLGTISRHRTCNQPTPSVGGSPCSGQSTKSDECNKGPCPEWSQWYHTDCSVTCGNGTMNRLRHCSTGRDSECTGMATDLVPCMDVACRD